MCSEIFHNIRNPQVVGVSISLGMGFGIMINFEYMVSVVYDACFIIMGFRSMFDGRAENCSEMYDVSIYIRPMHA